MLRVLVAEDGRFTVRMIARAVTDLGHNCEVAYDGVEALFRLSQEPFQVLVTDWDMPRMDGLELCRRVRASARDAYTYIIVLTAHDQPCDKEAALEAGADDFLTKPLDPLELAARLRVASRILTWESQLRAVNEALLRGTRELARVTEEIDALRRRAEYEANHDSLTGGLNRRAFFQQVEMEPPTAVAVVDIDHFKRVNDTYGHPAGDVILRKVCELLAEEVGLLGSVGRVGGEEFAIAFNCPLGDAFIAIERCRQRVAATTTALGGEPLAVTISAGIAPVDADASAAYRQADLALYEAKAGGRNRVTAAMANQARAA